MKQNTTTDRSFPVANEATPARDEATPQGADQFGAEANSADLESVKGGFGDVQGNVCVNAPGASGNTHIDKK